jgi:large subunit ribosomal protein L20
MSRATCAVARKKRHKKIIKMAKGYRGRSNSCYRIALQRVEKSLQYAYRDRRNRKRFFRSLWIQRINAAARQHGLTYSRFIYELKKANVKIDRKILSDLVIRNPDCLAQMAELAKQAA